MPEFFNIIGYGRTQRTHNRTAAGRPRELAILKRLFTPKRVRFWAPRECRAGISAGVFRALAPTVRKFKDLSLAGRAMLASNALRAGLSIQPFRVAFKFRLLPPVHCSDMQY